MDWWEDEGCFGGAACVAGGLEGNGRMCFWAPRPAAAGEICFRVPPVAAEIAGAAT